MCGATTSFLRACPFGYKTTGSKPFKILNIIDEYTRECLCTYTARHIRWADVQECLADNFCSRGLPEYIRSDNGSEFTAIRLREWLKRLEVVTSYIEPGSLWDSMPLRVERFY
jgi:putative transposase